ncbi:hypothetical protein vseg_002568 [Gypsophila vaccaria]
MAPTLVGPPKHRPKPPASAVATTADPFLNSILTSFNASVGLPIDNKPSTELQETGNPCLDLLFDVVPGSRPHVIRSKLLGAWDHDPLTTLKLICNLRGVRGSGKGDRKGFYVAAVWLHEHHPKTLACNLAAFVEFGCFKDFPEILFRVAGLSHAMKMTPQPALRRGAFVMKRKGKGKGKKTKKTEAMKEFRMREAADRQAVEKEKASERRHERKEELGKKVIVKYSHDPDYRFLHERVSDLFARRLREDVRALKEGEMGKISLAAKWCPSLGSGMDRGTLLCEAIGRKVFPREEYWEEYGGLEEVHYAYRVRDRLRREVLVPLRKALQLPELFMGGNRWGQLNYTRVASVAMRTYKDVFLKHDEERFKAYLEDVKTGKAKIAAGALMPHEIVGEALKGGDDGGEVAELQWKRMVQDLKKGGAQGGKNNVLGNCIGICDVSSSMEGTPLEVCVSLGILLSELSEEPWKGKVITFSENPELHLIEGSSVYEKARFIRKLKWGMGSNFVRVLELILYVAVQAKLTHEQMIKRVFVFSDMEFDKATESAPDGTRETDYMAIRRKYEENGFKEAVPEIVFWNLRDSRSTPVTKKQQGVALVSGFSKNAMKLFLEGKQGDPQAVMEDALSGKEYDSLVVLD